MMLTLTRWASYGPGSFAATEPNREFELRNPGTKPVTPVVIEAR